MRVILASLALAALAGCGQSGGTEKAASGGGGGQSANIAEGTISDSMIDLSASEGYGATSTVDEAPAATPQDGEAKKADAKPKAESKAEAEEPQAEAPSATESSEE